MDIYWNIFTMHGSMNLKSPNNTSKRQMEFNSVFKGLIRRKDILVEPNSVPKRLVKTCRKTVNYNVTLRRFRASIAVLEKQ
jgi:hypothetical protein